MTAAASWVRRPRPSARPARSSMALDVLALMDALKIEKAVLAGYDLGSRSADIIAALWPRRCQALVSTTGYLITNPPANLEPAKPSLEWAFWYQYYFSTERGVKGLTEFRHDLGELIWRFNSPTWHFSQATYNTTAAAFDNPDYVAIIIDNYRWRLDLVPGDPRYAAIEKKLDAAPAIAVPTVTCRPAPAPRVASCGPRGPGSQSHPRVMVGIARCPPGGQLGGRMSRHARLGASDMT
jgi:pimeloyl-ACP methyl ester carboxylesterase